MSAVYAGAVALFSGIGVHRQWAIIAAPAYVLAAVAAAAWKRRGLDLSLLLGFGGGLVVPLTWMAVHGESQREIKVIIRSAWSLIHHGTPYHSTATLAATQNPDVFNPYLPVMALFGMARTVVGGGVLTDPRVWMGITFIAAFALALSIGGAADAWRWTALVTATPLVAFPLAVGGDDLPVLGLMCLGLALLLPALAGLALALSLVIRPPRTCRAATWWLIIGLVLMFTLAPAEPVRLLRLPGRGVAAGVKPSSRRRVVAPAGGLPTPASPAPGPALPMRTRPRQRPGRRRLPRWCPGRANLGPGRPDLR